MTSPRLRFRLATRVWWAAAFSALALACSKDEATLPQLGPRTAPKEVAVSNATENMVEVIWRQEDGTPTGYDIERSVGQIGTNVTTFTIDAPATHFVDTTPPPSATLFYSVRARYGGATSSARAAEPLNVSYLKPTNAFASRQAEDDAMLISWTPPNKVQQLYDSFYILRFLGDDPLLPDGVFPDPLPETELEFSWRDLDLPVAESVGQRLQYGVSTEFRDVLSPPAIVTPTFQWSFATVPNLVQLGGARDHVSADAEYDAAELAVVLTNTDDAGSVQIRVIDTAPNGIPRLIAFSTILPNGHATAVVADGRIAVSHQAEDSSDMTVTTYDRATLEPITSATFSPGLAGVRKGPGTGEISVIEGGDVVVLDAETLLETDRHVVTGDAVEARYTSPTVLLTLERHGGTEFRLARRNILSDTFSWETDAIQGTSLRTGAVKTAPNGSVAAVTTFDGAAPLTTIVSLANGDILGTTPGIAMCFADGGQHVVIGFDDPQRAVEAVQTSNVTPTEAFGGFNVTAAYADGGGNVVTFDRTGTVQTYSITRDWWPAMDTDPGLLQRLVAVPIRELADASKGR